MFYNQQPVEKRNKYKEMLIFSKYFVKIYIVVKKEEK